MEISVKPVACWVLIKYFEETYREYYFGVDYKPTLEDSMHNTFTGKEINIKPFYTDKDEAKKDLERAREMNPSVGYALGEIN